MDELERLLEKQKELSRVMGMNIQLVDNHGVITELGIMMLIAVANDLAENILKMAYGIIERNKKDKLS